MKNSIVSGKIFLIMLLFAGKGTWRQGPTAVASSFAGGPGGQYTRPGNEPMGTNKSANEIIEESRKELNRLTTKYTEWWKKAE
ncbi:MAG: hypothetical protein LBB24_03105, partial [Rickettsiales bacterium]|nr:hypothetical protein [Rickettsiales bacterium]